MGRLEGDLNFGAEAIAVVDGTMWIADINSNKIFEHNILEHSSKLIVVISEEDSTGKRLFSDIVVGEDSVFLVPFNADKIYEIDKKTKEYRGIEIPCDEYVCSKFGNGFLWKETIWLTNAKYSGLIKYCCKSKTVEVVDDWIKENQFVSPFFRRCCLDDGILYAASYKGNYLLEYNLEKIKYKTVEIDSNSNGYSAVCCSDDSVFVVSTSGNEIVRIDKETYDQYSMMLDLPTDTVIADLAYYDEHIYVLPLIGNAIVDVNVKTGEKKYLGTGNRRWFTHIIYENEILFIDTRYGCIYRMESGALSQIDRLYNPGFIEMATISNQSNNEIFRENDGYQLFDFVNVL